MRGEVHAIKLFSSSTFGGRFLEVSVITQFRCMLSNGSYADVETGEDSS
jgi:hypothetical protein